jgi:hypothetical protein
VLGRFADHVFRYDLRADKTGPQSGLRNDAGRFCFTQHGEEWLRVPVSYLLKLALADVVSADPPLHPALRRLGERLMGHYLNDNSSPETHSFYVVPLAPESGMGRAIARETSKRFLLTQLLVLYANKRFGLEAAGQRAIVYFVLTRRSDRRSSTSSSPTRSIGSCSSTRVCRDGIAARRSIATCCCVTRCSVCEIELCETATRRLARVRDGMMANA